MQTKIPKSSDAHPGPLVGQSAHSLFSGFLSILLKILCYIFSEGFSRYMRYSKNYILNIMLRLIFIFLTNLILC